MIALSAARVHELLDAFPRQSLMVVGDFMVDSYLWGQVNRISPEAPVPVVEVQNESHRFGGAANVCLNVHMLGGKVIPVGVVGDDVGGRMLHDLIEEAGFDAAGLITDESRPTTVKTRVMAHSQQVVRADHESRAPLSEAVAARLAGFIESHIDSVAAVILEDYNKGVLTPDLIEKIVAMARQREIPVLVDPKYDNFFAYKGVTLFKPNRKEAADKLGRRLVSKEDVEEAGRELMQQLDCDSVLITLGADGMALIEGERPMQAVPTQARQVHDVSGAGDTVIATMGMVLSAGGQLREAAVIANYAAGQVVAELGIVPVDFDALKAQLLAEVER